MAGWVETGWEGAVRPTSKGDQWVLRFRAAHRGMGGLMRLIWVEGERQLHVWAAHS